MPKYTKNGTSLYVETADGEFCTPKRFDFGFKGLKMWWTKGYDSDAQTDVTTEFIDDYCADLAANIDKARRLQHIIKVHGIDAVNKAVAKIATAGPFETGTLRKDPVVDAVLEWDEK